jgi:hypothetical protein
MDLGTGLGEFGLFVQQCKDRGIGWLSRIIHGMELKLNFNSMPR